MTSYNQESMEMPRRLAPPDDERTLLLLGLLTSQDRHGYEINDLIEHQLHCVIGLKKATAYQLLDRLEQHGLISGRTEQHGQRPTRKVYALTPRGHAHFLHLLGTQLGEEGPLILPGNVPVMFCEHLSAAQQQQAFRERTHKLEARLDLYAALLDEAPAPTGVSRALERVQALTRADLDWTHACLNHPLPSADLHTPQRKPA